MTSYPGLPGKWPSQRSVCVCDGWQVVIGIYIFKIRIKRHKTVVQTYAMLWNNKTAIYTKQEATRINCIISTDVKAYWLLRAGLMCEVVGLSCEVPSLRLGETGLNLTILCVSQGLYLWYLPRLYVDSTSRKTYRDGSPFPVYNRSRWFDDLINK